MIIHITGSVGSGKTTLGNKLIKYFNDKIIVKDIDELRDEFIKKIYGLNSNNIIKFDKKLYQEYIDNYINKNIKFNKPLIFVGLNIMPWFHKNHYYDFHSNYNFFIKLSDKETIKQKCKRLLLHIAENDMDYLINNNTKFIKNVNGAINDECNLTKTIKENNKYKNDYIKQKYIFMTSNKIFDYIINKLIKQKNV